MTFAQAYTDWQRWPDPRAPHNRCSPNLVLVLNELRARWPLTSLGCYGVRAVRGGTHTSSHAYGAAVDVGFPPNEDELIVAQVIPFLVAWSEELHLSAIHDYRRSRIWHAGRTEPVEDACTKWWKAQRPSGVTGMGQTWANHLHLEVSAGGWADTIELRHRDRRLSIGGV